VYVVSFYQPFYVTGESNMKKSLCFNVACLIVGIGLVVALSLSSVWADAVGDCLQSSTEANKYCNKDKICFASGCRSVLVVVGGESQTHYYEAKSNRQFGSCADATSSEASCVMCKTFYCGEDQRYQTKSEGLCVTPVNQPNLVWTNNVCI
jgi:hypothetical protein